MRGVVAETKVQDSDYINELYAIVTEHGTQIEELNLANKKLKDEIEDLKDWKNLMNDFLNLYDFEFKKISDHYKNNLMLNK